MATTKTKKPIACPKCGSTEMLTVQNKRVTTHGTPPVLNRNVHTHLCKKCQKRWQQ